MYGSFWNQHQETAEEHNEGDKAIPLRWSRNHKSCTTDIRPTSVTHTVVQIYSKFYERRRTAYL